MMRSRPSGSAVRTGIVTAGIAIAAVAFNLRPALTSLAPVVGQIEKGFHLRSTEMGLILTLPVLCFGCFAPVVGWLARRIRPETLVASALPITALGIALRAGPSMGFLYVGTLIVGIGITIGNVLLPAVIKGHYPLTTGPLIGVQTMAINLGAATAAAVTLPFELIAPTSDWRLATVIWVVPAGAAMIVWIRGTQAVHGPDNAVQSALQKVSRESELLRSPRAWQVTLFFGLQSVTYYVMITWLPEIFHSGGVSASSSGLLLSLASLVGIPCALLLPILVGNSPSQREYVAAVVAVNVAGLLGLLVAPAHFSPLWAILLGCGQGASFPLALMIVLARSKSSEEAVALSAMAQTFGYLLASLGPVAVGSLREATGSWHVPLALIAGSFAPQLVVGLFAARSGHVTDPMYVNGG